MTERASKQGIHGWHAFLLMFGCGTLAALTVVGVIVGGLRLFASEVDSGSNASSSGENVEERDPIESMDEGALDLCTAVEEDFLTGERPRLDASEPPEDSGGNDGRTVTDDCEWSFTSEEFGQGSLHFTYRAFVTDGDDASRDDLASDEVESRREEMESGFSEIQNQGAAQNTLSDAYFYYGPEEGESIKYGIVGRVKSGVYSATFIDASLDGGSESEQESRMRSDSTVLDDIVFTEMDLILPD